VLVESTTVPRYVAFLRAINVGGHTVKMAQLRGAFEALGFVGVSTFIASGNVIFESDETESAALEQRIEAALRDSLGYEVATFLRTDAEVGRIAEQAPFPQVEPNEADTMYVVFLRAAPEEAARGRVMALSNEQDLLHPLGRELYWLRRGSLLDSTTGVADFGKALGGMPTTVRNANTLRRLAAKYPAARS